MSNYCANTGFLHRMEQFQVFKIHFDLTLFRLCSNELEGIERYGVQFFKCCRKPN